MWKYNVESEIYGNCRYRELASEIDALRVARDELERTRDELCRAEDAVGSRVGLNIIVARLTPGAISVSSSSHSPPIDPSIWMKPVRLPPGRGKLATNPTPTGSETTANTIGIVRVSRCSAAVGGVE